MKHVLLFVFSLAVVFVSQAADLSNKVFSFTSDPDGGGGRAEREVHFFADGQFALLHCYREASGKVSNPRIQRGGYTFDEGKLVLQFEGYVDGQLGFQEWIGGSSSADEFAITGWRDWNRGGSLKQGELGTSQVYRILSAPKLSEAFMNYANRPNRDPSLKQSLNIDYVCENDMKNYPWKFQRR